LLNKLSRSWFNAVLPTRCLFGKSILGCDLRNLWGFTFTRQE